MPERWATFDCYGTLIDWDAGIGDAMARLWPESERELLLRRYHAVEPLVQEGRSLPYREVLTRSLRAVAALEGRDLAEADATVLPDSLPSWPPFEEVPQALAELRRRGVRLAILSNSDRDLLDASLASIGVPVELAITAADAGSYKPAHGHWDAFFRHTGVGREGCVHVAASPFHDLGPARELGLTAVWANRTGEASGEPRAAELPDLRALPDVVDRLLQA